MSFDGAILVAPISSEAPPSVTTFAHCDGQKCELRRTVWRRDAKARGVARGLRGAIRGNGNVSTCHSWVLH